MKRYTINTNYMAKLSIPYVTGKKTQTNNNENKTQTHKIRINERSLVNSFALLWRNSSWFRLEVKLIHPHQHVGRRKGRAEFSVVIMKWRHEHDPYGCTPCTGELGNLGLVALLVHPMRKTALCKTYKN